MACHNGLVTPAGEDVSIGVDWRASMMANAARDPYWQAAVRRETLVHPTASAAIQNECSACHMPMARFQANAEGQQGEVFATCPLSATATDSRRRWRVVLASATRSRTRSSASARASPPASSSTPPRPRASGSVFGPFEVDGGRTEPDALRVRFQPAEG